MKLLSRPEMAVRLVPAPVCPRCQSADVEVLGRVHSVLFWFSCNRCFCIWWRRSVEAVS